MQVEVEINKEVFLPKYRPYVDSEADIMVLWGGRDSGKSHFIAQMLVNDCLENAYFKCILVRKVQDTIKDSQWATIKEIIEEWGLSDLFDFTTHPLEIRCINGNKFIARGCDKSGKAKGIKDPTHAWFEEMNQMDEAEYQVFSTTLRSNETKTREYWSFNPECAGDYNDYWLFKVVGDNYNDHTKVISHNVDGKKYHVNYQIIHSTYKDNEYCPPERKAKYLNAVAGDTYLYDVWINGWWGVKQVDRPFAYAFDESKHVSEAAVYRSYLPIKVSIDFNYDPFRCILAHLWRDNDGEHLHIFKELEVQNGSIEELARQLHGIIPSMLVVEVTGDVNGNSNRVRLFDNENAKLFVEVRNALKISPKQLFLRSNPKHKLSRVNYNRMLIHLPDFKIHPDCKGTIRDHKYVEIDEFGSIKKSNRSNDNQQADYLDCARYLENTFLAQWRKRFK